MTDINTVILVGRLTKDITDKEFCYTQSGTARLNLSLAVNRSKKEGSEWKDAASFFDVTVWGKLSESIKPHLAKGSQIAVEGYLDQQRWERNGQKHSKVVVIANSVQFIGKKTEKQEENQQEYSQQESSQQGDFPEDIPF